LDTCTIRNHLHGTGQRLDFAAIKSSTEQLRLSVAGGAGFELLEQLIEGRLPWSVWSNISTITPLLDDRWPLLPTGRQLAALAGTQTDITIDVEKERRCLRACWRLQSVARSNDDIINKGGWFDGADGNRYAIHLQMPGLTSTGAAERQSWIDYIDHIQKLLSKLGLASLDEDSIVALMKSNPNAYPGDPPDFHKRLDAVSRMIARFVSESLKARTPYNPTSDKRRGDVFDISLLFYVPLPSVVCTADEKFVNRLRDTGAPHAAQIVTVDELNALIRRNNVASLVSAFLTPSEQQERWQVAAYYHWVERGHPWGSPEADWFAVEPIS
jgi:hypothetical protein